MEALDLGYVLAGFVVGTIVGLTGVGGGSLMTPILILLFGIKPSLAVGTDLLFAAVTKFSGAAKLMRRGLIDWSIVGSLCLGSIPAALAMVYYLRQVGTESQWVQDLTTRTLGLALLLTSAATLYKAFFGQKVKRDLTADQLLAATKPVHGLLPILFGALIGVLVSLTSVGAGAIGVTALMLLYPALPLPRIVSADIAYAVPITLIAGLGHASIGSVDWPMLFKLLAGSLPGIWLGSHLMLKTSDRVVRLLLALLLSYAGFKLLKLG